MNIKRIANAVTFFQVTVSHVLKLTGLKDHMPKLRSPIICRMLILIICVLMIRWAMMRVLIELIKWLGNYRAIIHGQMPWIRKFELLIFFLSWCEYQPHSKHWQHCFSEARFPWESLNSFHSILFKFQFSSMVVIIWKQFAWNPFSRIAENLKTPVTRHGWCEDRKNSVRNFALVRKK